MCITGERKGGEGVSFFDGSSRTVETDDLLWVVSFLVSLW